MVDENQPKKKLGNPNLHKGCQSLNPKGRPPKTIDWDQVAIFCADHATEIEIGRWMHLCDDTISTACQRELGMTFREFYEMHQTKGKMSLRRMMWKTAEGTPAEVLRDKDGKIVRDGKGNPVIIPGQAPSAAVQIFKAKNELGYSDKQDIQIHDITLHVVEG